MSIIKVIKKIIIIFYVLIITLPSSSSNGNHVPHYVYNDCSISDFTYTSGSAFAANLTNSLINILPVNVSLTGYAKLTYGQEGVDQVNALAYCRGDIKGEDCSDCVEAAARTVIQKCRFLKEGIIWYQECTLRYANQSAMFSVDKLEVIPNHGEYNFSGTLRILDQYETLFDSLMNGLVHEAAYGGNQSGFATGQSNLSTSSYVLSGLVQCRPDMKGGNCESCLRQALRQRDGWNTPMVFLPSCSIRFDLYPNAHISPSSPEGDGVPLKFIIPAVVVGVLVLCFIITFIVYRHRCNIEGCLPQYEQDRPRKYTFLELVWATACFSERRILGRGGFGYVYKGTLLDGTQVAVKRLNYVPGALQGETEFVSEVSTITPIKHDNVVSLKGYCTFRRERILVYEYVANKTLAHHLHGNGENFSWEKRMRTAQSLAEVFTYLHERNPSIIHRDIKPSNILFDDEFQPKVGDFGVAKLCPDSRTHVTTIIRGSLGYVDPSCLTNEPLTTVTRKADVFAFGVVLLEMITGRKANSTVEEFRENRYIVDWAEPLIKEALSSGNFDALVDQNLGTTYDRDEMDRMVTCAATCVRMMPDERPTMRQVANVLKDSKELRREFKEMLMGFWHSDAQRRIYAEGGLGLSISSITVGRIISENSDSGSSSTSYDSFQNPGESHEFFYTASPIHHSVA